MRIEKDYFKEYINKLVNRCFINKLPTIIYLYNSNGFKKLNCYLKKNNAYNEFWENVVKYQDGSYDGYKYFWYHYDKNTLQIRNFLTDASLSFKFSEYRRKSNFIGWDDLLFRSNTKELLDTEI